MKKTTIVRLFSMLLCFCMVASLTIPAFAAEIADATIHMDKKAKLTIYKYDFTNAAKDGIWNQNSYVSTGQYDANINEILGTAVREGDTDSESVLGSNEKSNGYAIKGVEYTYLKVAEPYQFTESTNNVTEFSYIEVLYKFDKTKAADLLNSIGLTDGLNSYDKANALDDSSWYYRSDVLNKALSDSLIANPTTVKNALEAYVRNDGTAMPLTDQNGCSIATELEVGLYLLVETKVPEMVTCTTNPFFVSLPMTNINGGGNGENGNTAQVTDGGHAWLYDVTVYPKNETGIVTLEKTVREAVKDTGTNNGSATDIADGYKHHATASTGDTVEYQIISTLPTITSTATNIAEYTFQDVLARGLTYTEGDVKIEWFKDSACTPANKVAEWIHDNGKFTVSQVKNTDKSHTMTISMTEAGLSEINTANTSANNSNGTVYAGYSNYTMRITYAAVLNTNESMVYGDAGNCNEVVLTWRRSSSTYFDTLVDDCHIFTYGINLTKIFSDGQDSQDLFDHVLFKVQNVDDGYYVTAKLNEEEGIWYVTGHTTAESEATAICPVTWNNKKGQVVIKGLEDNQYILTEIETANSYTLLKDSISVEISAAGDTGRPCGIYGSDVLGVIQNDSRFSFNGGSDLALANIPQAAMEHNLLTASAAVDGNVVIMLADEMDTSSTNALAPLSVTNTRGFKLPQTGEFWGKWLPVFGGGTIAVAVCTLLLVLFLPKKKDNAQSR